MKPLLGVLALVVLIISVAACQSGAPLPSSGPRGTTTSLTARDMPSFVAPCASAWTYPDPSVTNQEDAAPGYAAAGVVGATARAYSSDRAACDTGVLSVLPGQRAVWIQTLLVTFDSRDHARVAFDRGLLGFDMGELSRLPGSRTGSSTGLGSNSLVVGDFTQQRKSYLAMWQREKLMLVLAADGLTQKEAVEATTSFDIGR